jgi:D-alanyl-D-alanine carboxypeptidase
MNARAVVLIASMVLCASCANTNMSVESPQDAELGRGVGAFVDAKATSDDFAGVVLLAHEGRPFFSGAYGLSDRERRVRNTVTTRFNVASLGKMFTAVAIAQLVEAGALSYDVPVGRYLPDLPNDEIREKVTLHHLLTHTSGIPDLPEEIFANPPAELSGYLTFLSTARLDFQPGEKRAYSNTGFVIAGLVIEASTGERYRERIRRKIFVPAQMRSTSFDPERVSSSYEKDEATKVAVRTRVNEHRGGPHGGSYSTAADLMRFFGALRDGKLVSSATATTMTSPRNGATSAYGFGVLDLGSDRLVGHSGGDVGVSADAYHYWRSGYTVVVLSNLGAPASHQVAGHARKLLETRFR